MERFFSINNLLLAIPLIGFFIVIWQIHLLLNIYKSKFWNRTDGLIINSELNVLEYMNEVGNSYNAKIKYQYELNGHIYISNRIFFGDKLRSSYKKKYINTLSKYPKGKQVQVLYNPSNPKESILERKISVDIIFMLIIGLIFIIIGVMPQILW